MRSKFKKARGQPRLHPAWSAATAGTKISPYTCAYYPLGSAAFAMLLKYHFLGNLHDHMPSNLQTIRNWDSPPLYQLIKRNIGEDC